MSMAVKDHVDSCGRPYRGDVNEKEPDTFSLKDKPLGPRIGVVVSQYDRERAPQGFDRPEGVGNANITQVPNLVRLGQPSGQALRDRIVRVGDDRDSHPL